MASRKRLAQISQHLPARPINTSPDLKTASVTSSTSSIPDSPGIVATITLSNPHKLNIVTASLLADLTSAFSKVPTSPESQLRAVILTSSPPPSSQKPPSFIGGAAIDEMSRLADPTQARGFITAIHALCTAIRTCPVPVIARCNGFCLGAGLEILASCDLRLATVGSVFGMPEVKVGIPSVVEARLLPDLIGWGRARRMLLLGENIDANTAREWGLIDEVMDDEAALDRRVDGWVRQIAANGARAVRDQKRLIREWEGMSVDAGIKAGIDAFAQSFDDGGREPRELMGRFLNRKR